jgi:hypothetical protein
MTPKEKAKELVLKFAFKGAQHEGEAKTFALIAVNEIIDCTPSVNIYPFNFQQIQPRVREYWQEVKKELEKL